MAKVSYEYPPEFKEALRLIYNAYMRDLDLAINGPKKRRELPRVNGYNGAK